jgi:hypothetical protein
MNTTIERLPYLLLRAIFYTYLGLGHHAHLQERFNSHVIVLSSMQLQTSTLRL